MAYPPQGTLTKVLDRLSVFPLSPYDGQTILIKKTGRKWEYTYDSDLSVWIPKQAFGPSTLYVDPTGTDDVDHGHGSGADAFKTMMYARSQIPLNRTGKVNIYTSGDTFNEDVVFSGMNSHQSDDDPNPSVEVIGTMTTVASNVATGGTNAAGANRASVTGVFVAGAHIGRIIRFTSGLNNGYERVIGYNTVATLWLDGSTLPAVPQNGDTYDILDWATVIAGPTGSSSVHDNCIVKFTHIKFTATTGPCAVSSWGSTMVYMNSCMVLQAGSNYGMWIGANGIVRDDNSYYKQTSSAFGPVIQVEESGTFEGEGTKAQTTVAGQVSVSVIAGGHFVIYGGWEISGGGYGLQGQDAHLWTVPGGAGNVTGYIHGCSVQGLRAVYGTKTVILSGITYAKQIDNLTADANGTNAYADATSFSYIAS